MPIWDFLWNTNGNTQATEPAALTRTISDKQNQTAPDPLANPDWLRTLANNPHYAEEENSL